MRRGGPVLAAMAAVIVSWSSGAWADDQPEKNRSAEISTRHVRHGFVPNDPYFHKNTPFAGWPGQWHLVNEHTGGLDARIQGAWDEGITGSGVIIGIVDDSLETSHPDLIANYVPGDSWDFGQNDGNPDPVHADDRHGTCVAGVAAARGGNGIGVTGAAPHAGLAGLRIDFPNAREQMFVDATLYHSSGGNTNIDIKNHSYGKASDYIYTPAEEGALETSAAAGTVHVLSAGNDRGPTPETSTADTNKKDLQNSPSAITVAALGSDGKYSSYSNYGACLAVTAPSDGGLFRITTTDRSGALGYNPVEDNFPDTAYTSVFGDTSSAGALVSGVMALVKEVQPNLDGRFAKHLLAMTSDVVDPLDATTQSDGGWRANGAGVMFNQNYGFGLIDAEGLCGEAPLYSGVTPLLTESTGDIAVDLAIPDNSPNGITRNFTLDLHDPLEELLVTVDLTHDYHGDIEIYLTSPSGTTSRLVDGATGVWADTEHIVWEYSSNVFWGEDPSGEWTINLADVWLTDTGTWHSFEVTSRMGQLVAVPEPGSAVLAAMGLLGLGVFIRLRKRRGAS